MNILLFTIRLIEVKTKKEK